MRKKYSKSKIILFFLILIIIIIFIIFVLTNLNEKKVNTTFDDFNRLEQQEVEVFNKQWVEYEGVQTSNDINELMNDYISNIQKNSDDDDKLPDLVYILKEENVKDPIVIHSLSGKNGVYKGGSFLYSDLQKIDTFEYEDSIIYTLNSVKTSFETDHLYYIELHFNSITHRVDSIGIFYNKPSGSVLFQDVDGKNPLTRINYNNLD